MKSMQIKKLLISLALLVMAPLALAEFRPGMTVEQAEAEVKVQLAAGATLAQVAQRALAAKLNAGLVTTALVNSISADKAADAVSAMINAGAPVQVVVNAALAAGATADSVTQGALNAGVAAITVTTAVDAGLNATSNSSPTGTSSGSGAVGGAGGGGGGSSTVASPS